jgi:hypothetical protein
MGSGNTIRYVRLPCRPAPAKFCILEEERVLENTARYVWLPCRPVPDKFCILEEERVVETQQDMFGYLADLPLINSLSWKRKG